MPKKKYTLYNMLRINKMAGVPFLSFHILQTCSTFAAKRYPDKRNCAAFGDKRDNPEHGTRQILKTSMGFEVQDINFQKQTKNGRK